MNNSDREIVEAKENNKSFLEINQQVFTELLTFVDFVDQKLNIGFVEVNFAQDRDILIDALINHQDCQNIQFEVLNFPAPDLRFLRDELVAALKQIKVAPDKKLILLITGLEKSIGVLEEYPAILTNLNFVRDDLRHTVCHPIILFLPEYALTRLAKYAPDFWSWGRKVFYFKTVNSTLIMSVDNEMFYDKNINSLELLEKKDRIGLLLRLSSEYSSPDNQENKQNLPSIINIYDQLCIAYRTLGEYQKALDYCQKSLETAQQIGDRYREAQSLGNLGIINNYLEEYKQAINYYQQSLEIAQEIGDRHREANSFMGLGHTYYFQGEFPQAINYYQQSLEIAQEIGDRHREANSFIGLGRVYYFLEEYQQAINYYQQSLEIAQQISNLKEQAHCFLGLGNAYNYLGESHRAIDYLQKSLEIGQKIGHRYIKANSFLGLGNAYNYLRESQKAIDYYQQSLEIKQEIGNFSGEANYWFILGNTWKNLHQKSKAKTAYENAKELYKLKGLDKKVEACNKAIQEL